MVFCSSVRYCLSNYFFLSSYLRVLSHIINFKKADCVLSSRFFLALSSETLTPPARCFWRWCYGGVKNRSLVSPSWPRLNVCSRTKRRLKRPANWLPTHRYTHRHTKIRLKFIPFCTEHCTELSKGNNESTHIIICTNWTTDFKSDMQ